MMSPAPDQWSAGSTYEQFMGRWSRQLSREFVRWLQIPDGVHWLEIGCGTGALTTAICAHAAPAAVVACDPSNTFLEYARAHLTDARVSFVVGGADEFPARAGGYESVTSSLALNFFPDAQLAVRRMSAASSVDGVVSACVWDYAEGMKFLRHFWDCALAIDAAAAEYDEGRRFAICRPDNLRDAFRAAGLADVRCEPLTIETSFASFDDYWQPFLGGTGPAPAFVSSLDSHGRAQLRQKLEATLPVNADGTITLAARAWAVRGTRRSP